MSSSSKTSDLVVAVWPLAGFDKLLHYRVPSKLQPGMLPGVLVLRILTAAGHLTGDTEAEVHPGVPDREAFETAALGHVDLGQPPLDQRADGVALEVGAEVAQQLRVVGERDRLGLGLEWRYLSL